MKIKVKALTILLLLSVTIGYTQRQLSEQAEIHIITYGPYQGELYSAFGHSGIRVVDPVNRMDVLFNYGIFDFNQPNFYLNFARGYLNYRLAATDNSRVTQYYIKQNRYVHEQVLNLTYEEKVKLFNALRINAKPENMHYYYDYFYDNCATRIRDIVQKALDNQVVFDDSHIQTDYTIRDLTDLYLTQQPWGDLGIDICLGLPMDKKASPHEYMFLPDYIESSFNHATIKTSTGQKPLVKTTIATNESKPQPDASSWFTPIMAFSAFLILIIVITVFGFLKGKNFFGFDVFVFSIIGLVGWLLFLLWIATDHKAAARNMNLLWATPLHIPFVFWLLKKKVPKFIIKYFVAVCVILTLCLFSWYWLPQDLPDALIPLVIALVIRSFYIQYRLKAQ